MIKSCSFKIIASGYWGWMDEQHSAERFDGFKLKGLFYGGVCVCGGGNEKNSTHKQEVPNSLFLEGTFGPFELIWQILRWVRRRSGWVGSGRGCETNTEAACFNVKKKKSTIKLRGKNSGMRFIEGRESKQHSRIEPNIIKVENSWRDEASSCTTAKKLWSWWLRSCYKRPRGKYFLLFFVGKVVVGQVEERRKKLSNKLAGKCQIKTTTLRLSKCSISPVATGRSEQRKLQLGQRWSRCQRERAQTWTRIQVPTWNSLAGLRKTRAECLRREEVKLGLVGDHGGIVARCRWLFSFAWKLNQFCNFRSRGFSCWTLPRSCIQRPFKRKNATLSVISIRKTL